ncbi:MAG: hypothetical protein HQ503_04975 [Rhodospirillales bacterium]|nr:hypothetical protein [Rhodospirillales bacterium]
MKILLTAFALVVLALILVSVFGVLPWSISGIAILCALTAAYFFTHLRARG